MISMRITTRLPVILTLAIALSGCNALSRLANVGAEPPLTTIQNPTLQASYRPVSMPMPAPKPVERNANSLWRTGARAFFKDQRASDVGDILTVVVDLDDEATLNNATTRTRTANEDGSLNAFLGYESSLSRLLPEAINPGNLLDIDSQSDSTGSGQIARDEDIELKIAAVISQVLPNGNLVIHGRQEFRVNFEARELQIAGIIRPEDISSTNTIVYEKIAEARISYGGRGQISDLQQPRYGQQVIDILFPF
ncbi:MAG: flagellar basal body L-ring protein FlgH [Alphaproteobacteria bacterium]|nr:flagellar basal body L-ring protein FlgH [Alphaproteobacteria bacterium]MCZ6509098.1 flagellar basal body L-ring protein FlgH [Alphaproteobacteria bacterium]MCZ6593249.1 flagellar basal body L-ring protein FlgH [Alphaproteobacteria bacterium]MCZ6838947.1 flagellar basal body L-ring protein FlgH [Alphaproteobacteria bacterium]